MTDVREAVLTRLVEVVGTITNLRSAHRNNVDITEDQLPAALVFDGDEETVAGNDGSRPSNRPLQVEMTPEIVIAPSGGAANDLATLRVELIQRVLFDAGLNALVGGNGKISFVSMQTDYGWGRSMQGALLAQFTFKYTLKPNDL